MAVSKSDLDNELKNNNNLCVVSDNIACEIDFVNRTLLTSPLDEESYYYYLAGQNPINLVPIKIVGRNVEQLNTPNVANIRNIFTLRGKTITPLLKQVLEENDINYSPDNYKKYIETAEHYANLRVQLMNGVYNTEQSPIAYQGNRHILPNTESSFSLGYNEDSYIKSSIAFEIEMYMRATFSKYGLLDQDIRKIFKEHNLKDAFLKLPSDTKEQIYVNYKEELEAKRIKEENAILDDIFNSDEIDKELIILKQAIINKEIDKKLVIDTLYKYIERLNKLNNKKDSYILLKKIYNFLYEVEKFDKNLNKYDIYDNNIKNYKKDYREYINKYSNLKKIYKYEEEMSEYQKQRDNLFSLTLKLVQLKSKINNIKIQLNKEEGRLRKNKPLSISVEEYNKIKEEYKDLSEQYDNIKRLHEKISNKVNKLEDDMSSYIFKDAYEMNTAYQDNRYTKEDDINNNYDNMLMLLNSFKRKYNRNDLEDYDKIFRKITKEQHDKKGNKVIRLNGYIVKDFNPVFSRKDERFTANKRKTKNGVISRFYPSKKEQKLDYLYYAELKLLGALLVEKNNTNNNQLSNNLIMAEKSIACELYLKSIIREDLKVHTLKDLFLKLSNVDKSKIVKKLNQELNLNYTKNEIIDLLGKDVGNGFSEYRYLYENKVSEGSLEFINALSKVLHEFAFKKTKFKSPYHDRINSLFEEDPKIKKATK